jgi:predicted Zn-dependent protease with MMP-like domain
MASWSIPLIPAQAGIQSPGSPLSRGRAESCELRYITIMADLASDPLAWRPVKAPSLAALEVLAGEVFRALPKGFRELCADLVIQVDDFPSEEILTEMQAETEFDLLGLFQGVGLPFRSESAAVQMPNMIWLYRRPILDYWAEHDETLGAIVQHVLVHEIGHHFGLSDDDMEALEQSADEAKGVMS